MTWRNDEFGKVLTRAVRRVSAERRYHPRIVQLSLLPGFGMLFTCGFLPSSTSLFAPFCVSFALTAVLTTVLARFLAEQGAIRRLLFPRTTTELAGALRWPTLGAHGAIAASKPDTRNHDR